MTDVNLANSRGREIKAMLKGLLVPTEKGRFDQGGDLPWLTTVWQAGAVLALLSAALVVLLPPWPPLQDYLEWVYQGVLMDRLLAEPGAGNIFAYRDHPVPNALSQLLVSALVQLLPVPLAAKLVMLMFLGLLGLIWRALRKLAPIENAAPAMVILVAVFCGSQFFNGYSNNLFGNAFLVLYVANVLRRPPLILETLIFSVLIFFCHATSFAVFGMVVTVHVVWRVFSWPHLLALVPTGIMFLWYAAAKDDFVETGLTLSSVEDWLIYKGYTFAKLGPYHNFFLGETGDMTSAPAFFWLGLAFNLAFAVFVVVLALQVFVRNRLNWIRDPAWVSVALILLAYPLMPTSVSGVVNIGERFLTLAVLIMMLLAVTGPLRWTLSAGAAISAFIIPVTLSLAVRTLDIKDWPRETLIDASIPEDGGGRMERLFWHRPLGFARRIEDIAKVETEGLRAAAPLAFKTSLLGPADAAEAAPTR